MAFQKGNKLRGKRSGRKPVGERPSNLTIRLAGVTKVDLQKRAKAFGTTIGALVREAIYDWLDDH